MISGRYFAVMFRDHLDQPKLASSGSGAGPMLFFRRPEAVKFKRELQVHMSSKCKVVEVSAEYNILTKV
jgi:hypothetical protein